MFYFIGTLRFITNPHIVTNFDLLYYFMSLLVFIKQNEPTKHWNSSQSYNEYWTWHIVHLAELCQRTLS